MMSERREIHVITCGAPSLELARDGFVQFPSGRSGHRGQRGLARHGVAEPIGGRRFEQAERHRRGHRPACAATRGPARRARRPPTVRRPARAGPDPPRRPGRPPSPPPAFWTTAPRPRPVARPTARGPLDVVDHGQHRARGTIEQLRDRVRQPGRHRRRIRDRRCRAVKMIKPRRIHAGHARVTRVVQHCSRDAPPGP